MNGQILAAAAAGAGWMAWAVRGRSSQVFGPSVWRGPRDSRAVALTFDDGPSESTPRILELLARHGAAATFFLCGANVERLPGAAREIASAGHEVASHGYAHPLYCRLTPGGVARDVDLGQAAIAGTLGAAPRLFRPPFGVRWFGLAGAQRRHGLLGVMWSAIGYDWSSAAEKVAERVLGGISGGSIVCLHDGRELEVRPDVGATIGALEILLPKLLERGYEMRTVSQLLCRTT